jgi:predicted nucleic acid-binding protein
VNTSLLRVVVTDANVLINLMRVSRLGLLGKIPNYEFVVPEHVREEITNDEQRAELDSAVADRWLKLAPITDLAAIEQFAKLVEHIGRREAACLVIAALQGWCVASDEKRRFRREAVARVGSGRILGTVDVFVLAIKAGLITVDDADADKAVLELRKFKMHFASFREPPSL